MQEDRQLIYQARQAVYALLQRLYQNAPDPDLVNWLNEAQPFADFPIALPEEHAAAALAQAQDACATIPPDRLREDFRALYVGPGPMQVPPWESVYRNEDHTLFDRHTLQVRETYARHGMTFVKKNEQPDDHLSLELEFMRVLTERLLLALEKDDVKGELVLLQEQETFLRRHLNQWLPAFIKLSQRKAATPFYIGLATVLSSFMTWEQTMLAQLLTIVEDLQED